MQHREVKTTPEKDRYIRRSVFQDYVVTPVARRMTWAVSFVLSVGSVFPLAFKMTVNVIDGMIFDRKSFKEAGKNLIGVIALPIAGAISSPSVLPIPTAIPYSPSKLGGYFVKSIVLPIRILLSIGKGNLRHFVQTKDMTVASSTDDKGRSLVLGIPMTKLNKKFRLAKKPKFSLIPGYQQQRIDTVDIFADTPTDHWRIDFLPGSRVYEFNFHRLEEESKDLKCNTRTFNYPGILHSDEMDSIDDYVNAGIAEVYALAKQHGWSNEDIQKNLHFYGYCFGASVAFQVAAYFKMIHNVDIFVFADRSPSSLIAASAHLVTSITGLPLWYSRLMCRSFLYAGGELNLDSMAAIKKLNPNYVVCLNLSEQTVDRQNDSCGKKAKFHLGIGKPHESPDNLLREDAVLANAFDTKKMFRSMGFCEELRIYARPSQNPLKNGHLVPLNKIQFQCGEISGTGFQFYQRAIAAVQASNDSRSHDSRAECKR